MCFRLLCFIAASRERSNEFSDNFRLFFPFPLLWAVTKRYERRGTCANLARVNSNWRLLTSDAKKLTAHWIIEPSRPLSRWINFQKKNIYKLHRKIQIKQFTVFHRLFFCQTHKYSLCCNFYFCEIWIRTILWLFDYLDCRLLDCFKRLKNELDGVGWDKAAERERILQKMKNYWRRFTQWLHAEPSTEIFIFEERQRGTTLIDINRNVRVMRRQVYENENLIWFMDV